MTCHTLSSPPELQAWVDARLAEGRYADVEGYVREPVRQDARAGDERARLRALIEEGLVSWIIDRDAEKVLDEVITEDPDLRD